MKIGFMGCGRMGEAMIQGMVASKKFKPSDIYVHTLTDERLKYIENTYGVLTRSSNALVAQEVDYIVIAVKPNAYLDVITEILPLLKKHQTIISITPSFTIEKLTLMTKGIPNIVRTIPNTPSMVGYGMTGMSFNEGLDPRIIDDVYSIFISFGACVKIDEKKLNILSTISGSSPAFIMTFMKSFMDYGINMGLTEEVAKTLTVQSFIGTGFMVHSSHLKLEELIDHVCSKGGSTIEGVEALKKIEIEKNIQHAIHQTTIKFDKMNE